MQQLESWQSKSKDYQKVLSKVNSKKKHFSKEQCPAFFVENFLKMLFHNKQLSAHLIDDF